MKMNTFRRKRSVIDVRKTLRSELLENRHLMTVGSVIDFVVNPDSGNSYYLIAGEDGESGISWTDAELSARDLNGHLATINDPAEYEWLLENFEDFYLWIGLNDQANEGEFVWSSGQFSEFENWRFGEPNNFGGNEDYVHIYNFPEGDYQWNDLDNVESFGDFPIYGLAEVEFVPTEDFENQVDEFIPGDSNMDGVFDSNDLIQVFQQGEYEDRLDNNSTWADGDWNHDNEFNSADMIIAFQGGRYEAVQATTRVNFPIVHRVDTQNRPTRYKVLGNDVGLSNDWLKKLGDINPEILLHGTDRGIAVEKIGWMQEYLHNSESCKIMFDFRVDVKEVSWGSNGRFGRTKMEWLTKVLTKQQNGTDGLYVLVIAHVEINKDRIGTSFDEAATGNRAVADERQRQGLSTVINPMPRSFVLEHELGHAYQFRSRFRAALDKLVQDHSLCQPTRPNSGHRDKLNKQYRNITARLQASHDTNYPNNRVEEEVRRRAWRLYDQSQQNP